MTLLAGVSEVVCRHPLADVAVYVDDATISAEADTEAERVVIICVAAEDLVSALVGELGGVALEKAAVFASASRLTARLHRRLGEYAGPSRSTSVVSLGIDYAAGRPRAAYLRGGRVGSRFATAACKMQRLRRLAAMARRGRTLTLFSQGVLPGATYGAAVVGVDPGRVRQLRRWAAQCVRPRAARRSLTALTLLIDDPVAAVASAALTRFASEVWAATSRSVGALPLP